MIIVPVSGDKIKTFDGLPFEVLSYSNLNVDGPKVIVKTSTNQESVFFDEIAEIAGRKVTLIKSGKGYNVFDIDGFLERRQQLPQIGEIVKSKISGIEERDYEVTRIRLHVKNRFSDGMILDCDDIESGEKVELTLTDLTSIDRSLFSLKKFLSFYDDYTGKGSS